jgi:nitrite reductase (NADH) small subunit
VERFVCRTDEIAEGQIRTVMVGRRRIAVGQIGPDEYAAVRDRCPHQGAPLSEGELTGTTLPSEAGEYRFDACHKVFRCPWHAWEFDARTGEHAFIAAVPRVKTYTVVVRGDDVYVDV